MKILLTAINAKYIHSNLAVYSLKAYAQSFCASQNKMEQKDPVCENVRIEIAEYTINQQLDHILMDIYKKKPDMLCFSCYIWNIVYVEEIVREIKKIYPCLSIWLGGPEVSYDAKEVLQRLPEAEGVMKGEGEETFAHLAAGEDKSKITGITYRDHEGTIQENPWRKAMDLSKVPFIYRDIKEFEHKIIYYESSRGCPFSCSYCLSSIDKKLRFRELELVKKELQFFIDQKVPQVKFVDRTFNCNHAHAMSIWKFLAEHDRGMTNFHFEISADMLNDEEVALIQSMRPGLIQLEIGVQSTNTETIREIRRTMNFGEVAKIVRAIQKNGNVHQHLDLIAGLPYENMESFAKSFDEVYALKPQQLQLGFLKVLKGSYMEEQKENYGLVYKSQPPYEVLYTKWLGYGEVLRLKGIEEMVELYYNSGQYAYTLLELETYFDSPFEMYDRLSQYYERQDLHLASHNRAARYEIFLGFISETVPAEERSRYQELLTFDYYLRENAKSRPEFAGEYRLNKDEVRQFYEKEEKERKYLLSHQKYDRNQMRKMTHLERFPVLQKTVLFDYMNRNVLTKEARTVDIS